MQDSIPIEVFFSAVNLKTLVTTRMEAKEVRAK